MILALRGLSGPRALAATMVAPQPTRVDWQTVVVALLEVLALGYLASRFFGPRSRRTPSNKPDVSVDALTRRRRPPG